MALSERLTSVFGGNGIVKRTLLYVAGFGLASLLVVWLLSLGFVSLAETLLPTRAGAAASASGSAAGASTFGPRPTRPGDLAAPKRRGIVPRGAPTDNAAPGGPAGSPSLVRPADNLAQNPAGPEPQPDRPQSNQAPPSAGEQPL